MIETELGTKKYPITVDERLIAEVPRMFSSFEDLLSEMAQNSGRYRLG